MNRFYGKTEVLEKITLGVDARLVGTDDPEEQGEKSHLESIDTVANDQDKKCCPGPLGTEENPDKGEKGRLVGVQNDMGKKCYPNSLRIKENPDKCEKSYLVGKQNNLGERCRPDTLEKIVKDVFSKKSCAEVSEHEVVDKDEKRHLGSLGNIGTEVGGRNHFGRLRRW